MTANNKNVMNVMTLSIRMEKYSVGKVMAMVFFISVSPLSHGRDYFNPVLLELNDPQQGMPNLARFEDDGGQLPGDYLVDILINEHKVDTRMVVFSASADGKTLEPCLSVADLASYGVQVSKFPKLGHPDKACASLSSIPQASAHLQFNQQQLVLSIPQAAIVHQPRNYVPPSTWDEGITALLFNYSFSGDNYTSNGAGNNKNISSQYANLRPGLNIGPWRVRNYATWSNNGDGQSKWENVYTYAQRNVIGLQSRLTLGDSNSPAEVFDAVPFRGVQIASDDEMLPDSIRGYAPEIRGIARTSALVIIRQNGYEIYRTYVAPGAFVINDLYPTGGSGDLQVTIKESNGSEQHMVVPFASLPVLQREGRLKYSLTAGQYRSYDSSVDKSWLMQGSTIYGLPWSTTLYGGVQAAQHYQSVALGLGNNLGYWGALSLDMTQSHSQRKLKNRVKGQSWRVRYSKYLAQTGTNFAMAGYHYSTAGFYSLSEVLDGWHSGTTSTRANEQRRNRAELSISQQLWQDTGNLSFNAVKEDYWNSERNLVSLGLGYSNTWQSISYGINWSYNRNTQGFTRYNDNQIALNVSMPLSQWSNHTWFNYSLNNTKNGATSHNLGLSGVALRDNNLSWGIQQSYGPRGFGEGGNLSLDYRGTYGEVNAGYSYGKDSQRLNYGMNGSLVVHGNGVTLGQPLGETAGLVAAPGASGTSITYQTGVRTDDRGYALVPYLTPYRSTEIALTPDTLPADVDVVLSSRKVTPTRGALVQANFMPRVGARLLLTLKQANGQPVPFGAIVRDASQAGLQGTSIVGYGGQVYLIGLKPKGSLRVTWDDGDSSQCRVSYQISLAAQQGEVSQMDGVCR